MVARIEELQRADVSPFRRIISRWTFDSMDLGRSQATPVEPERGSAWRIDFQKNGSFIRKDQHGWRYYSVGVQRGKGRNNVYADVLLPATFRVGRRRIQRALNESQARQRTVILTVAGDDLARVLALGNQSSGAAQRADLRSLDWQILSDRLDVASLAENISNLSPAYETAMASIMALSNVGASQPEVRQYVSQLTSYAQDYNQKVLPGGERLLRQFGRLFDGYLLLSADEFMEYGESRGNTCADMSVAVS